MLFFIFYKLVISWIVKKITYEKSTSKRKYCSKVVRTSKSRPQTVVRTILKSVTNSTILSRSFFIFECCLLLLAFFIHYVYKLQNNTVTYVTYITIRLLTLFTVQQQLLALLTIQLNTYTTTIGYYYYCIHTTIPTEYHFNSFKIH